MRFSWISLLPAVTAISVQSFEDLLARQLPNPATGVKTIKTANNVTIRYKEPGKEGVCETTPGVKSYSGYVDLSPTEHTFFWFFEARHDPENAPITLWLNGGPGSDSLIGLFEELGPCRVNKDNETYINKHSWNEVSNMLFLSQPLGVEKGAGTLNPITGSFEDSDYAGVDGRYPIINATAIDTTELAAKATWEVLQGFLGGLPKLDSKIKSKSFNLWTESYGGHYGPAFFDHFYRENQKIANGTQKGIQLDFNTLGIINGIIDEGIQAPHYPEFAVNNTYGIKAINDTVYNYMKFANEMPNGCQDQVLTCKLTNRTSLSDHALCTEATNMCRDNVGASTIHSSKSKNKDREKERNSNNPPESPYYAFSGRGTYDIRHPRNDPTPEPYYQNYLAKDSVLNALGVDLNYTQSNNEVYFAFQQTGDFVWPNFLEDLEDILARPVRVALIYGDADYICNWFGGEAVSLATKYKHSKQFRKAGYAPFLVDGVEYGETREYGNFSFTRVYEAGHEVPYYQPEASLQLFNRTLFGWELPEGQKKLKADFGSEGPSEATHTQSSVPLPTATKG
ncbi:unnamed protein product [Penicillium salamii]|nr:unnamed protein product [Penicillium salamii]